MAKDTITPPLVEGGGTDGGGPGGSGESGPQPLTIHIDPGELKRLLG